MAVDVRDKKKSFRDEASDVLHAFGAWVDERADGIADALAADDGCASFRVTLEWRCDGASFPVVTVDTERYPRKLIEATLKGK